MKRKLSSITYIDDLIFIDKENENVSYISSISYEKGDIYIITN